MPLENAINFPLQIFYGTEKMQKKYTAHLKMDSVEIHFAQFYVQETREELSVDVKKVSSQTSDAIIKAAN